MTRTSDETQSPPSPRRGRASAVAADAGHVGWAAFARMGFSDPTLVLRWAEIAGPEVARLAQPLRFAESAGGGTLTLKALPGAALFLGHETRSLCARINQFLGRPAVARLKFVQGPLLRPRPVPPPQHPSGPLAEGDPSRHFRGPEGLSQALRELARHRRVDRRD